MKSEDRMKNGALIFGKPKEAVTWKDEAGATHRSAYTSPSSRRPHILASSMLRLRSSRYVKWLVCILARVTTDHNKTLVGLE